MLFLILWIICGLAVWILYHQLFNVVYFDLMNGCFKEFLAAGTLGAILAVIITQYWIVAVLVIVLIVFALSKKQ